MDNFGLGNRMLVKQGRKWGAPVSVSATSYQGKHPLVYHPYLRVSYQVPHLQVVPFSQTLLKKLVDIGLSRAVLCHIPWGVLPETHHPNLANRQTAKHILGFPIHTPLFLWAGYIQQVQKKDFLFAVEQAERARRQGLDAAFYFAFKPESFEYGLQKWHAPERGIHVAATDVARFKHLQSAADVLYSPIINKSCIVAPPLTWIEMLNLGVPILTTDVPGASEIVQEGITGYMAENPEKLMEKIDPVLSS